LTLPASHNRFFYSKARQKTFVSLNWSGLTGGGRQRRFAARLAEEYVLIVLFPLSAFVPAEE